jgi:hypothetical protein
MGPGRPYVLTWDAATGVTTAIDIFEIAPADDKPVFIDELTIWQTTDFGDAQDEVLQIQIIVGYTTSGSGGASATVGRLNPGDAAAGFTAECRNTTVATTGTPYIIHADGWNVRAPYIWSPPSFAWIPYGTQALPIYVRLPAAPADSLTMNAGLKVREIG